jgi:RNA polymerase sigma-70 factor (ECF subfamily)
MAQDVFIRAYRALPRYEPRPGARLSTWLLKIAVRLVLDARKRKRLATVPLDEHHSIEDPRTPDSERRRRELAHAFERAAAELSDDHRMVFVLSHFHGLSHAQIAELVDVPENTVKTRLFRAKARLRTLLQQAWEDYR